MIEKFVSSGIQIDAINVRISHRIIQLFSEGLYSSPNKAIEERVKFIRCWRRKRACHFIT